MSKTIDAKAVSIKGRRVLFDANIWLILNGYSGSAPHRADIYSESYKKLLANGNTVVVNDYILGEYCNRCCKLEYESHKRCSDNPDRFPSYKEYRKTREFLPVMESVRDDCLNILDDCEFVAVKGDHYDIAEILNKFCDGSMDFTDMITTKYCASEDVVLMTDDRDFVGCNLEIITANKRLLDQ
ncbi:hypothetical protein [Bradyrhizobium sp. AUGA SZCCT0182]|uniref:hypothetical protein n=1 Tax=Bradyrhizobium sp. AUGA SZCCT0182 TaxID=2807667 RepID=UPI001BAD9A8A|nr:hypothetical protein [Bradyrhizobium sp. AUGA SZCCT0182]MBR1235736.1 hypothetical protein [Bradyrhizobium sp. AUGA SZCCT0182]